MLKTALKVLLKALKVGYPLAKCWSGVGIYNGIASEQALRGTGVRGRPSFYPQPQSLGSRACSQANNGKALATFSLERSHIVKSFL